MGVEHEDMMASVPTRYLASADGLLLPSSFALVASHDGLAVASQMRRCASGDGLSRYREMNAGLVGVEAGI